ncbi:MAG: type II secretion system GspH family protein [Elusimicrobiota bacterium]|jgi:prepilin-type N-terminal cleavage/methylation domain-containing protein|nr:type II secretion system GspH family protein [Elusimicrobiota bacterium]
MNKKAFTLIEMLVVILIIMILAAYAIFAYRDSMYEADNTKSKARLELINAGFERFRIEYPSAAETMLSTGGKIELNHYSAACSRTDNTVQRLAACGYIPKIGLSNAKENYEYFIGQGICAGGDGYAYMRPKTNADSGKGASYCAGISLSKGGKATDGEIITTNSQ